MEGSSSTESTTTTTITTNTPPPKKIKKRGAPRKAPGAPAVPRPRPRPYRRVADSDLTSRISDMQRKLELLKSKANLLEDRLDQHQEEKKKRTEDDKEDKDDKDDKDDNSAVE